MAHTNSSILPSEFNLTGEDIANYKGKFITVEQLENECRRRVSDQEGKEILNPYSISDFNRRYKNCSGIAYFYRTFFDAENPNYSRQYRVRRDELERVEKKGEMKEVGKYLSTYGAKNMLYVPHGVKVEWLADVSIPVVFFEGEDKATAAARVASEDFTLERWHFIPVAIPGVWNFRTELTKKEENGDFIEYKGLLPDFAFFEWKGRTVTIFFDANVHTNPQVRKARSEFKDELETLGAIVKFAELPKKFAETEINGFDDWLAMIAEEKQSGRAAIEAGLKLITSARAVEEKDKPKQNQATRILNFADDLELFHTPDGEAFARFETGGHFENHHLRSKPFRSWLAYQFFLAEGQMPSTQALQDAINTLEGKALFEGKEVPLFIRLAQANGNIYVDPCNKDWQIIEISKSGWRVIESEHAPVRFYRTKAMLPLPVPQPTGDIQKLRYFLNVNDDEHILILSWLVNCFRPDYPFPINIITGEQGSAKSTTSRVLRRLVDPNKTDFRSAPRDERDLVIAATNAWLCAYDNLPSVPSWLSDALCRISTGGGFATRTLYENSDETIFAAKRPILINGIGDIASKGDLLDRAIIVRLKPIPADKRKTESEFWREFEKEEAAIFSGLLDAVVVALRNIESVKLETLPRMADFAEWGAAAESAFGCKKDAFIRAYNANRGNANQTALEGSPLAGVICKYCNHKNEFGELFQGNLQEFLDAVKPFADDETLKSKDYPKTPRGVRSKLEKINPNLRAIGINVEFLDRTEKGQMLKLERVCFQPSEPSERQDAKETKDLMPDDSPDGSNLNRQNVSQPSANRQTVKVSEYNYLDDSPDVPDVPDGYLHTYSKNGNSQPVKVDEVI